MINVWFSLVFQSTPSSRRVTAGAEAGAVAVAISIHALLTEGDLPYRHSVNHGNISIHALLTEGDSSPSLVWGEIWIFQSTPSSRRATIAYLLFHVVGWNFNPRPPHGGRLGGLPGVPDPYRYFNPRPPHGGRLCDPGTIWMCS